jgi:NAD(P)-dependent dehydrogenase (short-subunit alcohol dehydrogenase family)
VVAAARARTPDASVADIVLKGGKPKRSASTSPIRRAVESVIGGVVAKHARIDILVNNAGIARESADAAHEARGLDAVMATT